MRALVFIIFPSLCLSGFTHSHLAEFQKELNSAVLKDMRSNKDNISVTVLAVEITRKESESCVFITAGVHVCARMCFFF